MARIKVSVYQRKDDKKHPYWVNYRLPDGNRVRKPAGRSRDEADARAGLISGYLNAGESAAKALTVGELAGEFLSSIRLTRGWRYYVTCRLTLKRFCQMYGTVRAAWVVRRQQK